MKLPELLAYSSIKNLEIAIYAGASSICLPGETYYEENLFDEIEKAVKIAHLYNVNIYLSFNTLIKEDEFIDVLKYIIALYKVGVNGIIVQDLGLIKVIKDILPKFSIHGSTQLNIVNSLGLTWAKDIMIKRISLAPQLNYEELKDLSQFAHSMNLESEILIHGELCSSYSGLCSFNRSENSLIRNKKYKIGKEDFYLLSRKNISLYSKLDELLKLDIDCFKVEGSIEDKDYIVTVINSYRMALNKRKFKGNIIDEKDLIAIEKLSIVSNREESADHTFDKNLSDEKKINNPGLYIGRIENLDFNSFTINLKPKLLSSIELGDVLVIESKDKYFNLEILIKPVLKDSVLIIKKSNKDKEFKISKGYKVYLRKSKAISEFSNDLINNEKFWKIKKSKIAINFYMDKHNHPILKGFINLVNGKKLSINKKGDESLHLAQNKPLTIENLRNNFLKIGKLPFIITDIKFKYNENLFAPISQINKLRREFFSELSDSIINSYLPIDKNQVDKRFKTFYLKYNNQSLKKDIIKDHNLSIYINDLNILKFITTNDFNFKRVYLEIPHESNDFNKKNKININYMVNFMKTAIAISKNGSYELIWKWDDIVHEEIKDGFIKAFGILNKLNIKINVMTGFLGLDIYLKDKYNINVLGSKNLNINNSMSFLNLKNYSLLTLSLELSKKDLINFINKYKILSEYEKLPEHEIIVGGISEILRTKIPITNMKTNNEIFLDDLRNNLYPIKKDTMGNFTILLNSTNILL
ncbi:MAG: U32 family peptidase, partial [Methanobrevibacter sp.]|nr:U32 family peptidase [Methanobrevibacter sp.]